MNREELRVLARERVQNASRDHLLMLLKDYKTNGAPVEVLSAARQELVDRYPCSDCGAPAGRECKHDYGCIDSDRR